MTYTALAKSLGISLKSVSVSSAASSCMGACVTTATTIDAGETGNTEGDTEKERSHSVSTSPASEMRTKEQGLERDLSGHISGGGGGTPDGDGDVDSDMDAEGISDSDIASTRPPTPTSILAQVPLDESSIALAEQRQTGSSPFPVSQATIETNLSEGLICEQTARRGSMTDDELHYAKVLVLDLLGWGVSPEYLLQRGISHALLYTVFTDLRLRLPDSILADCIKLVSAQS